MLGLLNQCLTSFLHRSWKAYFKKSESFKVEAMLVELFLGKMVSNCITVNETRGQPLSSLKAFIHCCMWTFDLSPLEELVFLFGIFWPPNPDNLLSEMKWNRGENVPCFEMSCAHRDLLSFPKLIPNSSQHSYFMIIDIRPSVNLHA